MKQIKIKGKKYNFKYTIRALFIFESITGKSSVRYILDGHLLESTEEATLVCSLLLIPVTILVAIVLPGNAFLPLASLAGMFYVFVMVLPYTNGSVVKSFLIGLIMVGGGLLLVTNIAPAFTMAAHDVYAQTGDSAVAIPDGFQAGAIDFSSSPMGWLIYQLSINLKWIGAGILIALTCGLMWWNRVKIIRNSQWLEGYDLRRQGVLSEQTLRNQSDH